MKFITRDSDYSMQLLLYLSKQLNEGKENLFIVKNISQKLGLPNAHLRKIVQILAKKKILVTYKGNKGGFSLVKSLKKITMLDIVRIFQGNIDLTHCYLSKEICPNIRKCGIRKRLKKVSSIVEKELRSIVIDHEVH